VATYLYRLGGWSFRNRRKVVALWALTLIGVIFSSVAFAGSTNDEFSVPGTESQEAQDLLHERYPGAGGASARIVFVAPEGTTLTDPANRAAIKESMARAASAAEVEAVVTPFKSGAITRDGTVGFADVIYPNPAHEIGETTRDELEASADPAVEAGMQVEFGGGLVSEETAESSESTGLIIAFVVLAIALTSLLASMLPLVIAVFSVALGLTSITALSDVITVSAVAPTLATMLGLAVGIDYTLFILARHRQNLADGLDPEEAAARATGTAGSAVVFAGLTVVIALVGLMIVNIPFLTVMGLAAAGTVTIAVLVSLTLLPALLGFAGHRAARTNRVLGWRPRRRPEGSDSLSVRWAAWVTRRPGMVLASGCLGLIAIAGPVTHLELGLPDAGSDPTTSTERRAYDLLADGFGPGFNGPLTIVVDAPGSTQGQQAEIAERTTRGLEKFPGVAAVAPAAHNPDGSITILSVTPDSSPSSAETKNLVAEIRDRADQVQADTGVEVLVTGQTAINIDTADRLAGALPLYILVVVGLALLLLMIVFRSVVVPVKAAAGFLLSIAASLGIVVAIFQDGHLARLFDVSREGPIASFLPVLLIGVLFGLAMDYQVFLVSRMREAFVHTGEARPSVVTGFGQSGRVVAAAALIMIGVFGSFVLSVDPITKSIGLALAFGVLVDAFVIRMTLVPAVLALFGRAAWWLPGWLDRRLPDVDLEGKHLETSEHRTEVEAAAGTAVVV
jgi:uncharacterized membrane protein YdfJ with MMPL/SSD domain